MTAPSQWAPTSSPETGRGFSRSSHDATSTCTDPGGTLVVVDVHSGPESQRCPPFFGLNQYFLSRGCAVFEPNGRGSTGYGTEYTRLDDVEKRMGSVRNVEAVVEFLDRHV